MLVTHHHHHQVMGLPGPPKASKSRFRTRREGENYFWAHNACLATGRAIAKEAPEISTAAAANISHGWLLGCWGRKVGSSCHCRCTDAKWILLLLSGFCGVTIEGFVGPPARNRQH